MRKLIVTGVVAGVVAVSVFAWLRLGKAESQQDLHGADAVRVTRRDVGSAVKSTGVIKPMVGAEVNVGSSVSGVVMRLFVRIGDRVQKGQLLAELDSRELAARRDAGLAALHLAQANLDYARVDLRRKRELHAAQIIAPSVLDIAEQAFAVAQLQCEQAQANVADAATRLGYTKIYAPIAGVVSTVTTQEGETVAASFAAPTFVTLLDLTRLEVWAYVDETDIGRIHIGQPARFTVDTYGEREFEGKVTAIHPKAEIRDNVVNYVAVVKFDAPRDYVLRPEMTTTVNIDLQRRNNTLALPVRAVHREGGRQFIQYRNGGKIERRWVTTGVRDDNYQEIIDGLHEGEEVLIGDVKPQ
jgi:RND family efflux transporter MFP subunit